jgi:hypothetical protein
VAAKLGDPDWGIVQSPFMKSSVQYTLRQAKATLRCPRGDGGEHSHPAATARVAQRIDFEYPLEKLGPGMVAGR